MTPVNDPIDWAFDDQRRCDDCGFDPREIRDRDLADAVQALGDRWVVFIDAIDRRNDGDALLHARPSSRTLSAFEYERHLRDRLQAIVEAVELAAGTGPAAPAASVIDLTDVEQDPDVVVGQIAAHTDEIAAVLRHITWPRGDGGRHADDLAEVARTARYALHEGYHHLAVAERSVESLLER